MWKRRRDVPIVGIMESYIGYCVIQYYSRLCLDMPFPAPSLYGDHRKNKVCQDKQALRAGCRPSVYQTHQTLSTPSFSVGLVPYPAAVVLVFFRLRNHFGPGWCSSHMAFSASTFTSCGA